MTLPYQQRAAEHAARRDMEVRRSIQISRVRLAVFLAGAAGLMWILARGAGIAWLVIDSAVFVAFGVLVAWHARVEDRVAWYGALRTVALRGVARRGRRWEDLPPGDPPSSIDLTNHPYAIDLDLFGRTRDFAQAG